MGASGGFVVACDAAHAPREPATDSSENRENSFETDWAGDFIARQHTRRPEFRHRSVFRGALGGAALTSDWNKPSPADPMTDETPRPELNARERGDDDPAPGVKQIILVMSGKGGVGKSTVCSNLALALKRQGYRVGLLDADMYGPSVPTMFGVETKPTTDGESIKPPQRFGIKLMSIGFMLDDPKAAVVWRGPMLHSAVIQFVQDVDWGDLDFLLLDMPPGTGDVALTLAQSVRSSGAVIVTTPQEVALQDVYKSVSMAAKVGINVLGVVENQSLFVCSNCGEKHAIFGSGGGEKIAEFAGAPLLGQVPIEPIVREWGDAGTPVVQAAPDSAAGQAFTEIAQRLLERVHEDGQSAAISIDRSGGKNRRLPIAR